MPHHSSGPAFRRREFLRAVGVRTTDADPPDPDSARLLGIVYGAAALVWLGMELWGLFGDCRPHDHDGQCGMSMAFATLLGTAVTLLILGVGTGMGIAAGFFARDRRRIWIAGVTAFLAGLAALDVDVIVGSIHGHTHNLGEAIGTVLGSWLWMAFLGGPAAFAVVYLVAADRYLAPARAGHATASRAVRVGAGAGMMLGFVLGLQWAYTTSGHAWLVLGGVWAGGVVGFVFWLVAPHDRAAVDIPAERSDARTVT